MEDKTDGTSAKLIRGHPLGSWIKSILKHIFGFGLFFGFAMFALVFLNR